MKSMTGYGRGEFAQNGYKITVELSSVNRKQSELALVLPRELESLDARIRDEINQRISRGRLNVRMSLHAAEDRIFGTVRLNIGLARQYVQKLEQLAKELNLSGPVSLDLLARIPGVLHADETQIDAETFWPATQKALRQAITALLVMRAREGAHLGKDLCQRMSLMRKSVERIKKQTPKVAARYREQLRARLLQAGLREISLDESRFVQEIVFFTDRADISEELTRLQSHFQQFDDCIQSNEPVGRILDFLAQEMNREVNTIGSKANDSTISRDVVKLKAELEKFREQVQNVE